MSSFAADSSNVDSAARHGLWRSSLTALGIALLACAIYALTIPANHTEAEDAFDYARQAEHPIDWAHLHPHHLLYIPLVRALCGLASHLGLAPRAYPLLVGISIVSAGIALAFFYLLLSQRLHARVSCSLWATALLGATYGFWRYACEAEIYLPALALVLATLFAVTAPRPGVGALVLAAAAGVVHVLAWLPIVLGAGAWWVAQRRVRRALAWSLACAPCAALTALPALVATGGSRPDWHAVASAHALTAVPVLLHDVMSLNFVMAFPGVRRLVSDLFPARRLSEEVFMGEHLPAALGLAAAATAVCVAGVIVVALIAALRAPAKAGAWQRRAALALAAAWLLAHALLVLALEPSNPEMWVMALPPLVLLATVFVLEPLTRAGRTNLAGAVVVALALHNACGGLGPLAFRGGDYNAVKADWLRRATDAADVVITADGPVFVRYLAYYLPCPVVSLARGDEEATLRQAETLAAAGGRIYVLGDVFVPSDDAASFLRRRCRPVVEDNLGGVFVLEQRTPPPDAAL